MKLLFTVPGPPIGKERPRLGKHGNVYTPAATRLYEQRLALYAMQAMALSKWPRECEDHLAVSLRVYWQDHRRRDLDNAAKCLDGLNHLVWKDDSQIQELHLFKHLDPRSPRLEVEVERLLRDPAE